MRVLNIYETEAQAVEARARGEFAIGADLSDAEIVNWIEEHERSGEKLNVVVQDDEILLPAVIATRLVALKDKKP